MANLVINFPGAEGTNLAILLGVNGDDNVQGGAGNDFVSGNAGVNILTGGSGIDFFFCGPSDADIITDFQPGQERRFGTCILSPTPAQSETPTLLLALLLP